MSPGLQAWPSGRFSTAGTTAVTLMGRPSSAAARAAPSTLAAPHMSNFISSMVAAGLMEIPPESKVTPLPTSTTGASPRTPPVYSRTMSLGGWRLPRATASRAPMPSSRIRSSSRTSAESESNSSARASAHSARWDGVHTLPGRLPRSRASLFAPLIAAASARERRAAARPAPPPPDV